MASNKVLITLQHIWEALESLHVPMAVMGGIALAAWEHVRATEDVDLLIGIQHVRADEVLIRLRPAGFVPKQMPAVRRVGGFRFMQLLYQPPGTFLELQVDLLLAESEYQQVALSRRIQVELPSLDRPVAVLTCEDLILHKLLAGRIIDAADCRALLRANAMTIDREYLGKWARQLAIHEELNGLLNAALKEE